MSVLDGPIIQANDCERGEFPPEEEVFRGEVGDNFYDRIADMTRQRVSADWI